MKKLTTILLAAGVAGTAFAQRPQQLAPGKYVATPQQLKAASYVPKTLSLPEESIVKAKPVVEPTPHFAPNGKVAAVNPVQLGNASNILTIVTTEQNQVWADNSLDLVAFIHRQDVAVWGGGAAESGKLRYDVSTDNGATFTNDIGPLNPVYSRPARYPNITGFNETGSTNPFDTKLVYSAPTLNPSPDFDGHVTGICDVTTGTATCTENYDLLSMGAYLPSGLTEGQPGEFWTVDREYVAAAFTGNFFVNKGVYNTGTSDVDWVRVDTVSPNNYTGFDGTATVIGPNIAFSPDGNTAWIAWLGDLVGGLDSVLSPIFMKSTDGGDTWSAPVEFNLSTIPWIADSLTALWTDSVGNPVSTGVPTCAFDYDLTVDANGNPHVAVVIGSGSTVGNTPGYSIYSGIAKFLGDIHSTDGGATWDVLYVAPVLAFRGTFGITNPQTMDNFPQISRNPAGTTIFYSYVDSDTAQFNGNMNGIGFGVSDNLAPNLRISSYKPATNELTYPQLVTDGDLSWEGRALYPTMAPISLQLANGDWSLPIVMTEILQQDPFLSCAFWYFGGDATVTATDYCDAAGMDLGWITIISGGAPCSVGIEDGNNDNVVLGQSYPNPTSGEAIILFELPSAAAITMSLTNVYGQQVATVASGEFNAGAHKVTVDTKGLAAGVYFYNLNVDGKVYSDKMIVTK